MNGSKHERAILSLSLSLSLTILIQYISYNNQLEVAIAVFSVNRRITYEEKNTNLAFYFPF
jgi:hypothetical protein